MHYMRIYGVPHALIVKNCKPSEDCALNCQQHRCLRVHVTVQGDLWFDQNQEMALLYGVSVEQCRCWIDVLSPGILECRGKSSEVVIGFVLA